MNQDFLQNINQPTANTTPQTLGVPSVPLSVGFSTPSTIPTPQISTPVPKETGVVPPIPMFVPSSVADATFKQNLNQAIANTPVFDSSTLKSNVNTNTVMSTQEKFYQDYLKNQADYQSKLLAALTPSSEEQALQKQLGQLNAQALQNQETALMSGETSSFAAGEAQRVGRTDEIKKLALSAQIKNYQDARASAENVLKTLIQSNDNSLEAQIKMQQAVGTINGIDKQAQETSFNIIQSTPGIGVSYDYSKTPIENLNTIQTARDKVNKTKSEEFSPREQTLFNSLVQQANNSPLIKAADRAVVLKDSIDNARANPKEGYVQQNLVYSYIQALDTYQSAVREGEMKAVSNLDSLFGRFNNVIQQINNGQYARPEVVKQMADASELLYNSISRAAQQKDKSFKAQADTLGIGQYWDNYRGKFQRSYEQQTQTQTGTIKAGEDWSW